MKGSVKFSKDDLGMLILALLLAGENSVFAASYSNGGFLISFIKVLPIFILWWVVYILIETFVPGNSIISAVIMTLIEFGLLLASFVITISLVGHIPFSEVLKEVGPFGWVSMAAITVIAIVMKAGERKKSE